MDQHVVPTNPIEPRFANDRAGALAELLARVEAATGASREIDCALACALDGFFPVMKPWPVSVRSPDGPLEYVGMTWRVDFCTRNDGGGISSPGHGGDQMVREYTASLDAALALVERVLPGYFLQMERCRPGGESIAGKPWWARLNSHHDSATASSPALALLAAMLRALEASHG